MIRNRGFCCHVEKFGAAGPVIRSGSGMHVVRTSIFDADLIYLFFARLPSLVPITGNYWTAYRNHSWKKKLFGERSTFFTLNITSRIFEWSFEHQLLPRCLLMIETSKIVTRNYLGSWKSYSLMEGTNTLALKPRASEGV